LPSTISRALLRLPAATTPITWMGTEGAAAAGATAAPSPALEADAPKSPAMARGSPTSAVPAAWRDGPIGGAGVASSMAQWATVAASAAAAHSVANHAGRPIVESLAGRNAGIGNKVKKAQQTDCYDKQMPEKTRPPSTAPEGLSRARARGFTLIEVMVVIVILGVLAALVVPRVMNRPDEARVVAARQDIASIMQALKLYRLDNQRYPATEQGLQALVTRPASGPAAANWKAYLDRLPVDPWGKPYQYLNPGLKGEIDVFSFGADGAPGGTGTDADIGSWTL